MPKRSLRRASCCPFCFGALDEAELDHMQPIARHGTDFAENLWVVCRKCNRAKGDLTRYEFEMRLLGS